MLGEGVLPRQPVARLPQVHLTDDQLDRIAHWEAVHPDFADESVVEQEKIRPILNTIRKHGQYTVKEFQEGAAQNYFAFLVCHSEDLRDRPEEMYWKVQTVTVNLSLYAPVGVIGRATTSYGTDFCKIQRLDLDCLIDPSDTDDDLTRVVIGAVSNSSYDLLSVHEVARLVPPNIEWPEDCYSYSPNSSVFSALFLHRMG